MGKTEVCTPAMLTNSGNLMMMVKKLHEVPLRPANIDSSTKPLMKSQLLVFFFTGLNQGDIMCLS